jgi:hypothetical protein
MRLSFVLFAMLVVGGCGDTTGGGDMTPADMAMSGGDGGGMKMFGDTCTGPLLMQDDCAAGLICDQFAMMTVQRCTRTCDHNPNPTNCPAPSDGTCNGKGECKFTQ